MPDYDEPLNTADSSDKNNTLAIILGAVGGVVLLTAIILGIYCFKKNKAVEDDDRMDSMIYKKDKQAPNVVVTKSEPDFDKM